MAESHRSTGASTRRGQIAYSDSAVQNTVNDELRNFPDSCVLRGKTLWEIPASSPSPEPEEMMSPTPSVPGETTANKPKTSATNVGTPVSGLTAFEVSGVLTVVRPHVLEQP